MVDRSKINKDKTKLHQNERNALARGASKYHGKRKKFEGKCYNCGKEVYRVKTYWSKKKSVKSNIATSKSEEEQEVETFFAVKR